MLQKGFIPLSLWVIALTFSANSYAESRIDYDLDDDGLIEINNLDDLNQIRFEYKLVNNFSIITGETLYGENTGCPAAGCHGYELTTDLDLDDTGDGVVDENDASWNDGEGFESIGSFRVKFSAEFNGNDFAIHNLVMIQPSTDFFGLIGYAEEAYIHDLKISASIQGNNKVGALLGLSWKTQVENIYIRADITGNEYVGGLAGLLEGETQISNVFIDAKVTGEDYVGGLTGYIIDENDMSNIALRTELVGNTDVGGMIGYGSNSTLSRIFSESHITGYNRVGGLLGSSAHSSIQDALITGGISLTNNNKYSRVGGAIGDDSYDDPDSVITRLISLMSLPEDADDNHFVGAIVGDGQTSYTYTRNINWASDLAKNHYFNGRKENAQGVYDLTDIQCASEQENQCNGLSFKGLANIQYDNKTLWTFGDNTQAPSIHFLGFSFSDEDGNGEIDDWPSMSEVSFIEKSTPIKQKSSSGGSLPIWFLAVFAILGVRRKIS
ncbi:MAG: GlyGly-CTERM sorting domain-containing protein [Gammaproteobacteria bacterium]|nr:GlyGly-CTERM sorting domain-containing protein [Gammaproteobacteria bacterium]